LYERSFSSDSHRSRALFNILIRGTRRTGQGIGKNRLRNGAVGLLAVGDEVDMTAEQLWVIVGFLVIINAAAIAWSISERSYSRGANRRIDSALKGWQRAIDGWQDAIQLHQKDRETFTGQKRSADRWPEELR
jgi:hypothetical protein